MPCSFKQFALIFSSKAKSIFHAVIVGDHLQNSGDSSFAMLFYSFFKSLVGKDVVVELKNDLSICGTLHSVDQVTKIQIIL